jgi:hypothetical protein
MAVLHCLYYIVHTHNRQTKWILCEFNSPTWRERRQLIGSLCCNLWQLRFGRNRRDRPRISRSHLDRPPKLRWVRGSLDPDCWMCSSHIRLARRSTNCKNIFRRRPCLDWETVVVFGCTLLSIFFPFFLQYFTLQISVAEWIFSMAYCSLPSVRNWKYAAYRGRSHVPAVDDDAGKKDTAIRCGLTLDGDWWQATGSDFHANTMTADCHLRFNVRSAGVGLGKTREMENYALKFLSRTTRKVHWGCLGFVPGAAQLNTVKQ